MTAHFEHLPLDSIIASKTNPRKRFNTEDLDDLADSIEQMGVAQPILVRPINDGVYEIVAGERRYRASRLARKETIPALIRELTDAQALELQVIENLQRADLHPLEEAEGYEQLMKLHKFTADDLAAKVGKSKSSVYARLKLLELCQEAREAFYADKLTPSTALLIARIPGQARQAEAVEDITEERFGGAMMSFRNAKDHIQRHYMLTLADASFDTTACAQCPKRTGSQPELFADIEGKDICTDTECFEAKGAAHREQQLEDARAAGREVISGDAAKKLKPYGNFGPITGGYVDIDQKCYDDAKSRTYREILGDKMPTTALLVNPHSEDSDLIEVIKTKSIEKLLKKHIIAKPQPKAGKEEKTWEQRKAEREEKAQPEREYRRALFDAVYAKTKGSATPHIAVLHQMTISLIDQFHCTCREIIEERFGIDVNDEDAIKGITNSTTLMQIIAVIVLSDGLYVDEYSEEHEPPAVMLAIAQDTGIDAAAIRQRIEKGEAIEPEPEAAPAAKKKTAAKKPATMKAAATAPNAVWPFPQPSRRA